MGNLSDLQCEKKKKKRRKRIKTQKVWNMDAFDLKLKVDREMEIYG